MSFTRNRKLGFPTLMLYFLNFRKNAAQVELDQFFKIHNGRLHATQEITKSAFFQARKQLSETAFIALNRIITEDFYTQFNQYKKWHGFRLCAVDGSRIRLPNQDDIVREFGTHVSKPNQPDCPMGLASVFFDVLNRITIDASINPRHASERQCAASHLDHAHEDDLVLYDRGYNGFWLYSLHMARNLAFCMRAQINRGTAFKAFVESGKREAVITLKPSKVSIQRCEEMGVSAMPVQVRLIRVDLPGEVEVLVTNLMDKNRHKAAEFKRLYHLRWGIEENYKRIKQWAEIENFSGKSALSIKQDFYAKVVSTNLTALMVLAAQDKVDQKRTQRFAYQVNFAQAISKMKHTIVMLISHSITAIKDLLLSTIDYIALTNEPIRPGRQHERCLRKKNRSHYSNYKQAL